MKYTLLAFVITLFLSCDDNDNKIVDYKVQNEQAVDLDSHDLASSAIMSAPTFRPDKSFRSSIRRAFRARYLRSLIFRICSSSLTAQTEAFKV
jgi:hypothetical protein